MTRRDLIGMRDDDLHAIGVALERGIRAKLHRTRQQQVAAAQPADAGGRSQPYGLARQQLGEHHESTRVLLELDPNDARARVAYCRRVDAKKYRVGVAFLEASYRRLAENPDKS